MARPSFKPTDAQRESVREWVQAKVSIEEMARRLELAPKTFRKYFGDLIGLIPAETVNTVFAAARPRDAGGFRPTDEQRELVLILSGARLSYPEIARKLDISQDVLEEHFSDQLELGPIKCKADILNSMFYAGKGGNVAAAKVYLVFNSQGEESDQQPAKQGLVGKKEAATIAASNAEAGTPWEALVPGGTTKPN